MCGTVAARPESVDRTKRTTEIVQSVLTSVAILVGGLYALYQAWIHRDVWQLATLDQKIESRRISPDYVWLAISVNVKNEGKVLLNLPKAKVIIYRVTPPGPSVLDAIRNQKVSFTGQGRIIDWPIICQYERTINFMLEPSETDVLNVDALLPASIRTVKVFTFLGDSDDPKNGWERATIHDITKESANDAAKPATDVDSIQPVCPTDK